MHASQLADVPATYALAATRFADAARAQGDVVAAALALLPAVDAGVPLVDRELGITLLEVSQRLYKQEKESTRAVSALMEALGCARDRNLSSGLQEEAVAVQIAGIERLLAFLQGEPNDTEVLALLAESYLAAGQQREALSYATAVVGLRPDDERAAAVLQELDAGDMGQ
jgi:tetratricopeptide (TPR) repeat protein